VGRQGQETSSSAQEVAGTMKGESMDNGSRPGNGSREDRWHREWLCSTRDLERIEQYDLQPMVTRNMAWFLKDTRRDAGVILAEVWTGEPHSRAVYYREYLVFLEAGLWWRVPHVRIRLVYDRRGQGKVDISKEDFEALYDTYFPGVKHDRRVTVEGLEGWLHNPSDPDAGLEVRPEVVGRLMRSVELPEEALIPAEEMRRQYRVRQP